MNRIKSFKKHTVKSSNTELTEVPVEKQEEWEKQYLKKQGQEIF